ncbi:MULTISPECIES: hypothetical protein [unclassified Kitasatospora]|uniref:hypothetical protein n=1 Tax=unclassified Kitasatospora TaxID=2633591 RepID=UPI0034381AEB
MALGATALATAAGTTSPAPSTTPPPAVEDFSYPGAGRVLKDKGLKLISGDGHIMLAECSSQWSIKVQASKNNSFTEYCFNVSGGTGYLALEVPGTFGLWNDDHNLRATLTSDGKTKTIDVAKDDVTTVGEADIPSGGKKATLVELRVTG